MSASQSTCDKFFRTLSKTFSDWDKVATHCGFVSDEITIIKRDNKQVEERSFQFLVKLRKTSPNLQTWSRKLREALRSEKRNDLAEQLKKFISKVETTAKKSQSLSTGSVKAKNKRTLPNGTTAKKTQSLSTGIVKAKRKRRLPNAPPGHGKLKPISKISKEEPSCSWYIKAWIDYMVMPPGTDKPKKGANNYFFHCFLQDGSGVSIYTSIFCKKQRSCLPIFNMIKASKQVKPIKVHWLSVKKQTSDRLGIHGGSNYRLTINDKSKVVKA